MVETSPVQEFFGFRMVIQNPDTQLSGFEDIAQKQG